MNNIIIQTIRAGAVLGVALFAFASTAFAAPMLTPVAATNITETSATIIGHVSNPQKNSTVWFEFYNSPGAPTTFASQGIWNGGTFEWHLRDLNPGQTYEYRSGAMEGGATVYSPTASFTTAVPKTAPVATVSSQLNSFVGAQTSASKEAQTAKSPIATKQTTPVAVITKEGFTRGNTAAVIGTEGDLLPHTLIGWVLLIIVVLVAVLVANMIYAAPEKRRKAREEEEKKRAMQEEEIE